MTNYYLKIHNCNITILCFLSIILHAKIYNLPINNQIKDPMMQGAPQPKNTSLRKFAILIFILQAVILLFYGIFVRMETVFAPDTLSQQRYGAFQDINVMMLIGFGFLMTFIKTNSLSALTYTFFINAIVMQVYILFSGFWTKLILGFANTNYYLTLQQIVLTKSSYCVASVLISAGAFIGRVGPKQMLIIAVLQTFFYSFNEVMVFQKIQAFDAGGSTTIHAFGAYFGLGVSFILSRKRKPRTKAKSNANSNAMAMIGTLFLWIFWPSFIFGVQAQSIYQQNQIVVNTIFSLTGSCMSTFMMSAFLGKYLTMNDVLNATLAGGVAIGANAGIMYQPALALTIGILAGVVSTIGFHKITPILQEKFQIFDTCGVNNLHGIPGIIGGIFSAMIYASYQNGVDATIRAALGPRNNPFNNVHGTFFNQGGLQIAGTFTSLGFGLLFGVVTGLIVSFFYKADSSKFFDDKTYIQVGEHQEIVASESERSLQNGKTTEQNRQPLVHG